MALLPNCSVHRPTLQPNVCPPAFEKLPHRGSQSANGSATSPFSTCVWASVPNSYWAQLTGPLNEVLMTIESGHKLSRDQRTVSSLRRQTRQLFSPLDRPHHLKHHGRHRFLGVKPRHFFVVQPVDSSRKWTVVTESTEYNYDNYGLLCCSTNYITDASGRYI